MKEWVIMLVSQCKEWLPVYIHKVVPAGRCCYLVPVPPTSGKCSAERYRNSLGQWCSRVKADSHIECRAHAVPLPCRAAKGLECVFPIWFTQCGHVWFTLAIPRPCHALTMLFFSRPRHSTAVERQPVGYLPAFDFFSGYHTEFHEVCYQKHTNPLHNDPYLRL